MLLIIIILVFMFQNTANTIKEEKNWTRIDYSGLATITFKEIKEL